MRALRYLGIFFAALLLLVGGTWYWALHTASGARWLLAQASEPVGISAASVSGDFGSGLALTDFVFANDSVIVSIRELAIVIDIDLFALAIDVVSTSAQTVDVKVLESEPDGSAPMAPAEVLQSLVLPVPLRISDLEMQAISISSGGDEYYIDTLSLAALWEESIDIERLVVSNDDLEFVLDATADLQQDNAITASVRALLKPGLTSLANDLDVGVRLQGYPDTVDVNARVGTFATITGTADWRDAFVAAAEVVLDNLDLAGFSGDWPAGFPVSGNLRVALDNGRVTVSESILEIGGTAARVLVDAEHELASEVVTGHLRWQHLRWPLPQDEVRVRSESGDIRLAGKVSDWTVAGTIAVATDEFSQGSFVIDAAGSREAIAGRIVESEVFGGRISGQAAYNFTDKRAWSADLEVANIQLESLLPEWPGRLSGQVGSHGTSAPFALYATLTDVRGTVRDMSLRANGAVDAAGGDVIAHDVRIEHGDSSVVLDGSPYSVQGLNFTASIDDIGRYTELSSGSLEANGRLLLIESARSLVAKIDSPALHYQDHSLEDLDVELAASDEQQTLQLLGIYRGTPFAIGVAGAFGDWLRPLETRFEGRVETLEIDIDEKHMISLVGSAPLAFTTQGALLQDFCVADETRLSLCANVDWQQDGRLTTDLRLEQMPVSIIGRFVDTGLAFDQFVTGTLTWHQGTDAGTGGSGAITISEGTVSSIDDPENVVNTGEGKVDFTIEDGRLLSGKLDLPLPGSGAIAGSFALLDLTRGTESAITGEVNIDLVHIRHFSGLSPILDSARGSLRATATIGGSVGEPVFDGDLELKDARLVYLPIGLEVSEINLIASMDSDLRFDLFGEFRAGEGRGEILSRADYSSADEPGLSFRLRGENLTLVNVPDVLVKVDPNIEVTLDRETLTINGEVKVPAASIKPTNLSATRINESEDVVIVAGELPDPPEEEDTNGDFDYQGELTVSLGDKVVLDLDVAEAKVSGSTVFEWQGDKMPSADGRYNITGNIEAFGQVLDITKGSIQFPNVPADEPYIRLTAEREIFGNTQIKRAGVLIDGPVKRPIIVAYTSPHTTEERALTLLVTGSDFDYEQGVGAIDFGTYIAPRLFVSYGVGVFERENVISARYDLNKGFGIKASSGATNTGMDLNYRFEN